MILRPLVLATALAAAAAFSPAADSSLHVRDGKDAPPRLYLVQNYWGFDSLPTKDKPWTRDEALARMKAAGYDAVDVWGGGLSDAAADEWKALASKHGLGLGMEGGPAKIEDLPALIATMRRLGSPYLDLHVANYFLPEKDAETLLRALSDKCRAEGVAMVTQTHRGRVTQDLIRTVGYAKAIPALRFDLDLSHYFVAGEIGGTPGPEAMAHLEALMERAVMLDGRVSNGEQVQIDLGAAGDSDQTRLFAGLWKKVMIGWLKAAARGDLFPFRVELGPPNYAILDPAGREISDRWEQQKRLGKLAERLWNEAVKETGIGQAH
jgi:sugar phosphate isomerase/epimerase